MNNNYIYKYYLSPFLVDIVRLFNAYKLKGAFFNDVLLKNKIWHNKYKGEKVFIIGNGPSINNIDIELLKNRKAIVMNSFEHATWKDSINIIAHCIGEPAMVSAWSKEEIQNNIYGTNAASYWLHYTSYGHFEDNLKTNQLHYVFLTKEPGLWGKKELLLDKPTLAYQTTAQMAIQVALYMGFKEIGLLGFDHDWLASPDYSKHFYSNEKDAHDTLNEMTYLEIVYMIERMWKIYYKLQDIATWNNAKIYNLTEKSHLDVFEKKNVIDFLFQEP